MTRKDAIADKDNERDTKSEVRASGTSCSLCGYTPPPALEGDETISPSDVIADTPLTCWLCDEIAEMERDLAGRKRLRDERARCR